MQLAFRSCATCGRTLPRKPNTGAAGYAVDSDGRQYCYPCADAHERAALRTADRYLCYLTGRDLTTWTGGQLLRVVDRWSRPRRDSWVSAETVYLRAVDSDGRAWHGQSPGDGMYARMRRNKATV